MKNQITRTGCLVVRAFLTIMLYCSTTVAAESSKSSFAPRDVQKHDAQEYIELKSTLEQALAEHKQRVGEKHIDYLDDLNELGMVCLGMAQYEEALTHLGRSLALRVQVFGAQHLATALAMNNLALLFSEIGMYAHARQLFESALTVRQKQPGAEHRDVADSLNNLGLVLQKMGHYCQARPYHEQALAISRKSLGEEHPDTAKYLARLGRWLMNTDDANGAIELYQQAFAIQTKTLGEAHPETLATLHDLGTAKSAIGKLPSARDDLERAIRLRKRVLGDAHPHLADSFDALADVLAILRDDAAAETHYRDALAIRTKALGAEHCDTAASLSKLAELLAVTGRGAEAIELEDRARRAVRQHVACVLGGLSEPEQLQFLCVTDRQPFHAALSLGLNQQHNRAARERSAEWLLNGKGLALETLTERTRLVRDEHYVWFDQQLVDVRRQLAAAALAPASADSGSRRREIEALRTKEQELARQRALISRRPDQRATWVELDAVRQKIAADAVLIEIARFDVRNFQDRSETGPARYAAWVIPSTGHGEVDLIDMGETTTIDAAIERVRTSLSRTAQRCREVGEQEAEHELMADMNELADRIWKPLAPSVRSAKKLILSPDSSLWLAPWAALSVGDGRYLVEDFELQYVGSGHDLLTMTAAADTTKRSLIVADPDFDLAPREAQAELSKLVPQQVTVPSDDVRSAVFATSLPRVNRLPGTATEASLIAPNLERFIHTAPEVRIDREALEGIVKAVRSPDVVVLSTHGYFLPDRQTTETNSQPIENPLLRCGLLLAGCNQPHVAGQDDGVLTGLEIVGLDLRGTRLVVLSACETGVGQVRTGEGVAGLRQAFLLAGAQSVVATLWQVPDRQSVQLMNSFFKNLASGLPPADALRSAQTSLIASRRERFDGAHPFFWAAFTVTGL